MSRRRSLWMCLALLMSLLWAACGEDTVDEPPSSEPSSESESESEPLPSTSGVSEGSTPPVNCAVGTWDADGDPSTPCEPWTVCVAGQSVAAEGSATADRQCEPCGVGTFSEGENEATCQPWRDCEAGQFIAVAGSATQDRVCETCAEGTFTGLPNSALCQPHGACAAGRYQVSAGTETEPPVCEDCDVGTFCAGGAAAPEACPEGSWDHDANPASACVAWSDCMTNEFVAVEGTRSSDRECDPCPGGLVSEGPNAQSCVESCTSDDQCGPGAWCPTDTEERRCAPNPVVDGVEIPFQWVPGGEFTMGSPEEEVGRDDSREDQVEVELTRDYFVQRTPVTQGQWAAVMAAWNALPDEQRTMSGWSGATPGFGTNPSYFGTAGVGTCTSADCPVERVSWWDALVFANVLSLLEGLEPCYEFSGCDSATGAAGVGGGCSDLSDFCGITSGEFSCSTVVFVGMSCIGYRLPTEAEWERAARAGTTTATYGGDLSATSGCVTLSGAGDIAANTPLADLAWYDCNSSSRTQSVGQKTPNAWGLYDMLGNVLHWTDTWFEETAAGGTDPVGPSMGLSRVLRGGAWSDRASSVRAAGRANGFPGTRGFVVGFRLVRSD